MDIKKCADCDKCAACPNVHMVPATSQIRLLNCISSTPNINDINVFSNKLEHFMNDLQVLLITKRASLLGIMAFRLYITLIPGVNVINVLRQFFLNKLIHFMNKLQYLLITKRISL